MRAALATLALLVAIPAAATIIVEPDCVDQPTGVPCDTACTGALYGLCRDGRCQGDRYHEGAVCAPVELGARWFETVGACDASGYCIPPAPGDCDGDGRTTVAELVGGVAALLEGAEPCVAFDRRSFGVDRLVAAVAAALGD